jgi:hypothetical protein
MSETILLEAKTYTLQQYADNVAHCHANTVLSKIKNGNLPSNHHVLKGKQYIITIQPPTQKEISTNTELAIKEFSKLAKVGIKESQERQDFKCALATDLAVKYGITNTKMFKLLCL